VRQFDIHLSIFAYDEPSLELAVGLEPDMLKLNSSELSNPQMLIGAGKSRLPLTLGTGASSIEEIRRGVKEVVESGGENLILMHGVQNFPTPIEEANLQKIRLLKDEFKCLIIYADHTDANSDLSHWIDLLAIGQGAALLEKHLVLDRTRKGVDWEAALEPDEFSQYVAAMKKGSHALGPYKFQPFTDGELRYRRFQKKSLVAARNMEAGHEIEPEDIQYLRVQGENEGITPYQFEKRKFGRKLARSVTQFSQLHLNDFVKGD